MTEEKDLQKILKTMRPNLHLGEYVFCTVPEIDSVYVQNGILIFKEDEGITVVLRKEEADRLGLAYSYVAAWITLTVHSSLEAVGLTAAFSQALSKNGISCNVVAAYYHDHIFVAQNDAEQAMEILKSFSEHSEVR